MTHLPAATAEMHHRNQQLHPVLGQRDVALLRRIYPVVEWMVDRYYRAEVEGVEHLSNRASLTVATHNGGMYTPDAYALMLAFWRRFGLEAPGFALAHRMVSELPVVGSLLIKLGAIPASYDNAAIALQAGFPLMVCPGGDLDTLKPFRQRHRIVFGNRQGFVRIALKHQVPIIPVVSVGAHEVIFVLNDGRRLAQISGLARRWRVKTVPFALSVPFGITPAGLFALPLPSKVRVRVLPPIVFCEPPSAADDREAVRRCCARVRCVMQRALDQLAATRRRPILG